MDTNGVTIDQDHTFNNRGNIEWAEDVVYLDHLENTNSHSATKAWVLAPGHHTINLGGNSPATVAKGRQGYLATFSTTAAPILTMARASEGLEISWPVTAAPVKLYESTSIDGSWSEVAVAPTENLGIYKLSVPLGTGTKFYRLK